MKRYIKPTSELIELKTKTIILITSLEKDEEEMGGGSALTNEQRGDWEDIWDNM